MSATSAYWSGRTAHSVRGSGFRTENTVAGLYLISVNGGKPIGAYCTDLADSIAVGESWVATKTTVQDPTNGLGSITTYPGGVHNVPAIDYIAQNYVAPPSKPAAQIAIWDLVEGSQVTLTGSSYAFGTNFSETGFASQADLQEIYTIEQAALNSKVISGATFENAAGALDPTYGRPQDLAFDPIPEPAFYQMGVFLAGGGLTVLRLRRKKRE